MAGTFKFELVTPERMLLSEDAAQVIVPGMDGEFTVLPGHAPVISALRPGVIDAQLAGGRRRVFVRGGFAEVGLEHLTVLAQHMLDLEHIDADKLASEVASAEQMLAEAKDDATRMVAGEAVERLKELRA